MASSPMILLVVALGIVSLFVPATTLICLIVAQRRLWALERRLDRIAFRGTAAGGEPAWGGQVTILRLMIAIAVIAVVFGIIRALGIYVVYAVSLINFAVTIGILVSAIMLMRKLHPADFGAKIDRILPKPDVDLRGEWPEP